MTLNCLGQYPLLLSVPFLNNNKTPQGVFYYTHT
nr:MAG TPA: hypothetical protein [Caudoviricetes sp.]